MRKRPFGFASAPLAVAGSTANYDRFDPLAIFSSSSANSVDTEVGTIYDADIESAVTLQRVAFDPAATMHGTGRSDRSVLRDVLTARAALGEADRTFAALNKSADEVSAASKGRKSSIGSAVAAIVDATRDSIARPASTTALGYAPASTSGLNGSGLNGLGLATRVAVDGAVPPSPVRDYPGWKRPHSPLP